MFILFGKYKITIMLLTRKTNSLCCLSWVINCMLLREGSHTRISCLLRWLGKQCLLHNHLLEINWLQAKQRDLICSQGQKDSHVSKIALLMKELWNENWQFARHHFICLCIRKGLCIHLIIIYCLQSGWVTAVYCALHPCFESIQTRCELLSDFNSQKIKTMQMRNLQPN